MRQLTSAPAVSSVSEGMLVYRPAFHVSRRFHRSPWAFVLPTVFRPVGSLPFSSQVLGAKGRHEAPCSFSFIAGPKASHLWLLACTPRMGLWQCGARTMGETTRRMDAPTADAGSSGAPDGECALSLVSGFFSINSFVVKRNKS